MCSNTTLVLAPIVDQETVTAIPNCTILPYLLIWINKYMLSVVINKYFARDLVTVSGIVYEIVKLFLKQ